MSGAAALGVGRWAAPASPWTDPSSARWKGTASPRRGCFSQKWVTETPGSETHWVSQEKLLETGQGLAQDPHTSPSHGASHWRPWREPIPVVGQLWTALGPDLLPPHPELAPLPPCPDWVNGQVPHWSLLGAPTPWPWTASSRPDRLSLGPQGPSLCERSPTPEGKPHGACPTWGQWAETRSGPPDTAAATGWRFPASLSPVSVFSCARRGCSPVFPQPRLGPPPAHTTWWPLAASTRARARWAFKTHGLKCAGVCGPQLGAVHGGHSQCVCISSLP